MSQNNRVRLRQQQEAKAKQQRLNRIVALGAAIVAVVLIAVFAIVLVQNQSSAQAGVRPPNATADGRAIVVNPGKAKPGAPVVELFFDYQCPVCKQLEDLHGAALATLADDGDIELRYRTLTFLDLEFSGESSTRAGVAAACADVSGVYSAFHNQIFANQPEKEGDGYPDELLRATIPATVGLTGEKLTGFQACFDNRDTKPFVRGTYEAAGKDGVSSTPTLHVNGHDIPLSTLAQTKPTDLPSLIAQNA